jgi:hypothetical protein
VILAAITAPDPVVPANPPRLNILATRIVDVRIFGFLAVCFRMAGRVGQRGGCGYTGDGHGGCSYCEGERFHNLDLSVEVL